MKRNVVRLCIISIFLPSFSVNVHSHLQKSDQRTAEYIVKNYSSSSTTAPNEKSRTTNFQRCSPVHAMNMNAKCPAEYSDREVIRKCERGLFPLEEEDISIIVPASNLESRVHYANRYCASCHNDSAVASWELVVKWAEDIGAENNRDKIRKEILPTLYFDKIYDAYAVRVNKNGESRICEITSVKPENIGASNSCTPSVISECPTVHEGPKECDRFRSNVLICTSSSYFYLNRECARCNNVSENSIVPCLQMMRRKYSGADTARISFGLKRDSESCSIPAVAKFYCSIA